MANGQLNLFIRHLKRMVGPTEGGGLSDAQLLERWIAGRDEAAFEVILWRHGPMVLGVCRRVLADAHDVDDAFQATFLTFVRCAAAIRKREALGAWLYQVAYRVALRARVRRQQRAAREEIGVEALCSEPSSDPLWRDVRPVLDEEIDRLPTKYRAAFVLCYLQGQTNEEAAQSLGCPVGTIQSRLAWARERLRNRLSGRGVTVTGTALIALLSRQPVASAAPAHLIDTTLKAALAYAAGSATAGVVSTQAVALTQGVVRSMFLNKLKIAAAVVIGLGLLGGTSAWAFLGAPSSVEVTAGVHVVPVLPTNDANHSAGSPDASATVPVQSAPAADEKGERRLVDLASPRDGVVTIVGAEIKEGEQVPADQIVVIKTGQKEKRYRRLKPGDSVGPRQFLAQLDDRLARDEVAIREAKVLAEEANLRAAEATKREAIRRYERAQGLAKANAMSDEEVQNARVTAERFVAEHLARIQLVQVARLELNQAQTILELHTIRSPVKGVITKIYKHPGEAVKALEAVFQIRLEEPPK
jgi:RNA polymerase sigma factor (sigma-70 family)